MPYNEMITLQLKPKRGYPRAQLRMQNITSSIRREETVPISAGRTITTSSSSSTASTTGYGAGADETTSTNWGWSRTSGWSGRVGRQTYHGRLRRTRAVGSSRTSRVSRLRRVSLHVVTRIGRLWGIGIHWSSRSHSGVRVHLVVVGGISRRLEIGTDVIQGHLAEWLMWSEKWAPHRGLKLTVVEDVDPHRRVRRQHRGVQHRVVAPTPDRELNVNHHGARRRHPLKTTRKRRSEKY